MVQESLRFGPAELVFGHIPRGPSTILKEKWLCDLKSRTLLEYVTEFCTRIYRVRKLAKQNLEKAQDKMKTWFDKKAREQILTLVTKCWCCYLCWVDHCNLKVLLNLSSQLPNVSPTEKADVLEVVSQFLILFSDIPGQMSVIEHDIDVGSTTQPIKQHPYCINPLKRALLQKEVQYILDNYIGEPSSSPWSSTCLLIGKSD